MNMITKSALLAGFLPLALTATAFAGDATALKGKPMPKLDMAKSGGGTLSTASLKGKVVVLDFWATWCAPCVGASPVMQKLYEKYSKQGLVIVGSNITDSPAKVAEYAKKHNYTFPFTSGNAPAAAKLGIQAIPVFLFIDRKGVVQRVDTGVDAGSPASWEKTIQSLLKS